MQMTAKAKIISMYNKGFNVDSIESFTGARRRYIQGIIRRTAKYLEMVG